MTDVTQLVDRYIDIWNETEAGARADLVARSFTERGAYVDPLMKGEGHAGIDAMIAAVQDRFPGFVMRRTSDVDAHNGVLRFNWALGPEGSDAPVKGQDIGEVADGRLARITGFLDQVPG
jgi:hypothetical protein